MDEVKIKKPLLLAKVRTNREKHFREYEEAVRNFREAAIERLREHLTKAEQGDKIELVLGLSEPQSYLADYDQIITMIEMSADNILTLNYNQFQQYVMDNWHWKHNFSITNTTLAAAASSYKKRG